MTTASRFLVTGGAGFIGSHVVAELVERGHPVRVLDDLSTGARHKLDGIDAELAVGRIEDPETLQEAMSGCSYVVHLAARISVSESCADPVGYDRTNVQGTLNVFEAARKVGVRRVVYASSAAVYGSSPQVPTPESAPLAPESPYAAAKAANELYAHVYSASLGLSCVGLRFFNVFGPRQDADGPYAAVISAFIDRVLLQQPIQVHGDGKQARDFVAVQDVARACALAALTPRASGVYNVGRGTMVSINELAEAVMRAAGTHVGVVYGEPRQGDARCSLGVVDRAARELGWSARIELEEALCETIRWATGG